MKSLMPLSLIMVAGIAWITGPGGGTAAPRPVPRLILVPTAPPTMPPVPSIDASFAASWRPDTAAIYFNPQG